MFKEFDMDLLFGALALLFWVAVWALARGCERLRAPGSQR